MQGKLHPHWYIPTTTFPFIYTIRAYQSDWSWYQTLESDNSDIVIPNNVYSTNGNDSIPITFNNKVSQFTLIENVYTANPPENGKHVFSRKNVIHCYYPDDFTITATLTPADSSLTVDDMDALFYYDGAGDPAVLTGTFNYYNKLYIGRRYKYGWAWKMEVNPHTLAEAKGITDYDFVLMKYVYWDHGGQKAIVSNRNYYPMGWFDVAREYWTLFSKTENERLYCVRRDAGSYHGVGINEIQYLKLI